MQQLLQWTMINLSSGGKWNVYVSLQSLRGRPLSFGILPLIQLSNEHLYDMCFLGHSWEDL